MEDLSQIWSQEFKIEHGRVKEHKKRHMMGIFFEKWLKSKCKMCVVVVVAKYKPRRVKNTCLHLIGQEFLSDDS